MAKTKKLREIKSKIKKVEEKESKLEEEIKESETENFSEFMQSRGNLVPVLDAEQQNQDSETEEPQSPRRQAIEGGWHEQTNNPYLHSNTTQDSRETYITQTSLTPVTGSLRQGQIIAQRIQGFIPAPLTQHGFNTFEESMEKKYISDKKQDKKGYAWE